MRIALAVTKVKRMIVCKDVQRAIWRDQWTWLCRLQYANSRAYAEELACLDGLFAHSLFPCLLVNENLPSDIGHVEPKLLERSSKPHQSPTIPCAEKITS